MATPQEIIEAGRQLLSAPMLHSLLGVPAEHRQEAVYFWECWEHMPEKVMKSWNVYLQSGAQNVASKMPHMPEVPAAVEILQAMIKRCFRHSVENAAWADQVRVRTLFVEEGVVYTQGQPVQMHEQAEGGQHGR